MDDFRAERLPEHDGLDKECSALEGQLRERLDEEGLRLLDRLVDAMNAEADCFGVENRIRGYRLGVLMMTEVYLEQGRYRKKKEGGREWEF